MPKDTRHCIDSLRHNEYYDMQDVYDELYKKSKENSEFPKLMDIILSENNILLAYRNIKTNGGSITPGMAIYGTMRYIKADVSTICIGMAASMGAFLLNAGAKGKRFALPNSTIMIHQPLGGAKGQATDIEIHAKWILQIKERLNKILSERTGQPLEKIKIDTERDNFMNAKEAKEYGLVDEIIEKK